MNLETFKVETLYPNTYESEFPCSKRGESEYPEYDESGNLCSSVNVVWVVRLHAGTHGLAS